MKTLVAGLQAHLDTGATTLCWCWRLTRRDGTEYGFTDHDRPLTFDGTTFEAASGFTATEIQSGIGLSVDNLDVEGALNSNQLNEDDLSAGCLDDAAIEIFRVNWADVTQRVLIRTGNLGEVKRGELAFVAEMRGLAHRLQQKKGRLYKNACDAILGDARCAKDISSATFTGSGSADSVEGDRLIVASGLDSYEDEWFERGFLTWTSGGNDGVKAEIKAHRVSMGRVTVELWDTPAAAIAAGDDFIIVAGCDKQFSTCKAKFDNAVNFRGFPHMPGNDFVASYPNTGDDDLDGGGNFVDLD